MSVLYSPPDGPFVPLRRRPVPADQDGSTGYGPDWRAEPPELAGYLDEVERDLGWWRPGGDPGARRSSGPGSGLVGGHLSLELRLGLFPLEPLDRGHGLDTYLFPVVRRLGPVRFDAVFATKEHAGRSGVRVAPSAPATGGPPGPPQVRARLNASATGIGWKEELFAACRRATPAPAPAGPVALQVRLGVSRRRNWSALWKPALDALGPILGVPDPTRPYRAADDRISELALHRRLDDVVGNRVDVEIWWRPAGPDRP